MIRRRQFKAGLYSLAAVSATAMARSDLAAVYTPAHGEFPADIVDFSASQLSLAIRLRTVSCEEVMRAYLKHIHRYNPVYGDVFTFAAAYEAVTTFLSCRPVLTDSSGVATR